ncbi:unnamed protein product, partial [Leptidea sinapis]
HDKEKQDLTNLRLQWKILIQFTLGTMSKCPPPPPDPCAQACAPAPPPPPCLVKPIMRGLHWSQTERVIYTALGLSCCAGALVYFFLGRVRRAKYKEYYARGEFEEWADEMARKGLFQSVPKP